MAKVVAVVVTYDSAGVLAACLSSLTGEVDGVIVVDNASADDSRDVAERLGARVIAAGENLGYGAANNRGVAAADGAAWCLIVNPDVTLEKGCVAALTAAAAANPKAALLVPSLVEPDGRLFFRGESVLGDVAPVMPRLVDAPPHDASIAFASGACMLVSRDVFLKTGGFDERIFLYYEDDDLSLRIRQAGSEIRYVQGAAARHLRGKSTAPKPGATRASRYHLAWSRAYISRKYELKDDSLAVILRNGIKYVGALLTANRPGMERYGGSVAGALAARRGLPSIVRGSGT